MHWGNICNRCSQFQRGILGWGWVLNESLDFPENFKHKYDHQTGIPNQEICETQNSADAIRRNRRPFTLDSHTYTL